MNPHMKTNLNNTILRFQRTTPYYKKFPCCRYYKEECFRGVDHCPLHGSPSAARELLVKIQKKKAKFDERYYRDCDPAESKLTSKAPSLEPPNDKSIKTLSVGGLDERINEQDLRVNFFAHGEIETIKMVIPLKFALVTYKTREGAEKAAGEISNCLCIKGLRLKLMWHMPPAPKPDHEASDEARQQAVAQSGLPPRSVTSQQQNHVFQPPGYEDEAPELPPPQQRGYYPSLDPQTMGAAISSREGSSGGSN